MNSIDHSFSQAFSRKRVLITGHTGFKGSWLAIWLHRLGAEVVGVALDPVTPRDNYLLSDIGSRMAADLRADIRDGRQMNSIFQHYQPEVVFHLAAQPLVRRSYQQPVETYQTNLMGTINVMEAIRHTPSVRTAVMITTDKCYENREQTQGYQENDPMGGYDPYSSSKGCAELAISSWRRSFFNPNEHGTTHHVAIASARAGNVVGGGDWAQDRIVPDCIRAIEQGVPVSIRSPKAVRPWQHVLEPLSGYLLLAARMQQQPTSYCEGWNFGPCSESVTTVWDVAEKMVRCYGNGTLADCSDPNAPHEARLLTLDISKARRRLGWQPRTDIDECCRLTAEWYRRYRHDNVYNLCCEQIDRFTNITTPDHD